MVEVLKRRDSLVHARARRPAAYHLRVLREAVRFPLTLWAESLDNAAAMQWSSKQLAGCLCLVLSICACVETEDSPEIEPGLHLDGDAAQVSGTFSEREHELRFWTEVSGTNFDIRVELNGMTLTVHHAEGTLRYDGYASESGATTQMTDNDRSALLALSNALDELGPEVSAPVARLRSFASVWSEFPSTMELAGTTNTSFRAYASICEYVNNWVDATHDDGDYERWDDRTTFYAWVSMHEEGPCEDGTWFWKDGAWSCYEPDHDPAVEYAYGACFGRCGASCGSSSQFTYDCLDHDACVRFGHTIAGLWCDDEFATTTDDWVDAPNCL